MAPLPLPFPRLPAPPFAFGLIPGPREVVLVLLVVLALYGRAGSRLLWSTPYGRLLAPWAQVVRGASAAARPGGPAAPSKSPRRGRLFWVLTLTAAAAALAWIATRIAIHNAVSVY